MKTRNAKLWFTCLVACAALACNWNCGGALVSVNSITNSATTLGLFFDPEVTLPSATNLANYSVFMKTGQVGIVSVAVQTNAQFVELKLASPIGEFFAVSVSNIVDLGSVTNETTRIGYLSDFNSVDVGVSGNPNPTGRVFTAHPSLFEVTVGGSDVGGTNDFFHFIGQQVISNFDLAVNVERLDQADALSKAGLIARESLTPGSRTVQTFLTPVGGSNDVQVAVRAATNGTTTDAGFQIGPRAAASSNSWLRLTRTNNTFTAYHGNDGQAWTVSGITTQAFAATLNIGTMVAARTTNGTSTTAKFSGFGMVGARPGDGTFPTLSASLSGTNLLLNWLRTPRDFTVLTSTNLIDWGLLLSTITETGTNGTGRAMVLPAREFTNTSFFRLVQVDRVIPDPPLTLYTGLILTLASNNVINTNAGLLCSIYTVTNAISQTNMNAMPNKIVTFSTSDSDVALDTVLRTRWVPDPSPTCDDNSAGGLKSIQRFTNSATRTNFTLIAAVKTNTPASPTSPIKVTIVIK